MSKRLDRGKIGDVDVDRLLPPRRTRAVAGPSATKSAPGVAPHALPRPTTKGTTKKATAKRQKKAPKRKS